MVYVCNLSTWELEAGGSGAQNLSQSTNGLFLRFISMSVLSAYICVYCVCVWCMQSKKRALDPLEVELRSVVSHHVYPEN